MCSPEDDVFWNALSLATRFSGELKIARPCPLWVKSRHFRGAGLMSALALIATVKTDIALQGACSSRHQQRSYLCGTHSLRRTKATLIYRRTGNLRAVQLLLGHTKIESTVRYLGIDVDDALAIAEQVDV